MNQRSILYLSQLTFYTTYDPIEALVMLEAVHWATVMCFCVFTWQFPDEFPHGCSDVASLLCLVSHDLLPFFVVDES